MVCLTIHFLHLNEYIIITCPTSFVRIIQKRNGKLQIPKHSARKLDFSHIFVVNKVKSSYSKCSINLLLNKTCGHPYPATHSHA